MQEIASKCVGFSGASLAGVARAAASHALERAVTRFSTSASSSILVDCLVTRDDFVDAVSDVTNSEGDSDFSESETEVNGAADET